MVGTAYTDKIHRAIGNSLLKPPDKPGFTYTGFTADMYKSAEAKPGLFKFMPYDQQFLVPANKVSGISPENTSWTAAWFAFVQYLPHLYRLFKSLQPDFAEIRELVGQPDQPAGS
jgi:hypothetical protein